MGEQRRLIVRVDKAGPKIGQVNICSRVSYDFQCSGLVNKVAPVASKDTIRSSKDDASSSKWHIDLIKGTRFSLPPDS